MGLAGYLCIFSNVHAHNLEYKVFLSYNLPYHPNHRVRQL
jgi:hypothetical protein